MSETTAKLWMSAVFTRWVPQHGSCIPRYTFFVTFHMFFTRGNDIYRLDEGVVGSGMGLFLTVGHWPKILLQNSKGAS